MIPLRLITVTAVIIFRQSYKIEIFDIMLTSSKVVGNEVSEVDRI